MDKESIMNSSAAQKLSDLMSNVIIYAEVRTGEDNRSEGIKKVISSLGAKVNNRLTKNTTHVIFKDGLLSTYKKAKQMNIPLVSILWIEACKKNFKLMDPLLFPISNIDRYEFPEMYDKFKKIKNMQPDAVDAKDRLKHLKQTQKNIAKKLESPVTSKMKLPKIPRTPKDNLNNILSEFQDKIMSTPDNDESFIFESKLLQKIQNSPFIAKTPAKKSKFLKKIPNEPTEESISFQNSTISNVSIRESSRIKKPNSRFINEVFISEPEKISKKINRRRTIASTPRQSTTNGTKNLSSYFTPIREKNSTPKNVPIEENNFKTPVVIKSNKDNIIIDNISSKNISNENSKQSGVQNLKEHMEFDDITPVSSSNNLNQRRTLYTPQNMEFATTFDSAKKPSNNKRRTMYDISLGLIDKGLKNINEQLKSNRTNTEECTILEQTNISGVEEITQLPSTPTNDSENTPIIKKRKLFMPDQFELTPIAEFNKSILSSTKRSRDVESAFTIKNVDKKRRTTINVLVPSFNKENRRSSFDFDKFPKNKIILTPQVNKPKITKILVCTNMHKEQLDFIQRAVKSLGEFVIETNVTEKTTHVVSLECRRTINIIKGIIRGLWVLKYEWIVNSFNNGKWLHEETYELREFSRSVSICRSERQAFGSTYRMEIFSGLTSIYVSNKCKVPIDSLKDIIKLSCGQLAKDPKECKYVIGDYYEGKICLQPQWILDCITNNKILKFFKYLINPENNLKTF